MILRALAVTCLLALSPPAQAQGAASTARQAAEALRLATEALEDATAARDQIAGLSAAILAYEDGLATLREALRQAAVREAALAMRLEAERARVSRLLGVLSGIVTDPGPLLLLHPSGPVGTARSGMMLAEVTPALQAEVATLRAAFQEVAYLRALQAEAAAVLQSGLVAAQAARSDLSQAIAARGPVPRLLTDDPEILSALIAGATSLDAVAEGLGTGFEQIDDTRDFATARGTLPLPALGTVLRRAGEADAAGVVRPGLVLATRAQALVTAPWSGTIRYRGPLLDYGNVMLIEPGPGYLLIFAGMRAVFGEPGEVLAAGAPLGLMGGGDAAAGQAADLRLGTGGSGTETLYIEIRRDAVPIDPAPWFIGTKE